MTTDCIFCRIATGTIPASLVFEDELTLAFMDIGQVNPGHVIVATRAHHRNVFDLDDETAAAVFRAATRVAKAMKAAFAPEGATLLQANEPAGFQTVFHFHLHVIPRHAGDGVELTWPAKNPPRERLEEYAQRLRDAIRR